MGMLIIKQFITHYYLQTPNGRKCFEGVNILACNFKEAQEKIKIHNKFTKNKLYLDGEFIETI